MNVFGLYKYESELLGKDLRFLKTWRLIAFVNIGIIIYLSLTPTPEDIGQIFGLDKVLHVLAYSFSMFWSNLCYRRKKYIVLFSVGLILMGIILEIAQGMTDYRTMSPYDMIANSVGVFLGLVLARTRLSMMLSYIEKRFIIS